MALLRKHQEMSSVVSQTPRCPPCGVSCTIPGAPRYDGHCPGDCSQRRPGGPGNSVIGETQEEPEETRLRRNKVLDL